VTISPETPAAVGLGHAAPLAALHGAAVPADEAWSAEAFARLLAQPSVFGLMAGQTGLILARVVADEAEILALAVAPGSRRRGTGSTLLRAAMREAAERGARTMLLEVARRNAAALKLYQTAGFRIVGCRARYYPDGADALVLAVALSPSAAEST
jgi:ribosomal-protein-alanine N-acetyltransferase